MKPNTQKLHHLIQTWDKWKSEYHTDEHGRVIFQNKELLSNIIFDHNSFHTIKNHLNGFENIPETLMNPDEVWSRWADPKTQMIVLRNYIKDNYIVQTKDGVVQDGFLVDNVHRFRQGVILNP